jgi:hypothetical protein
MYEGDLEVYIEQLNRAAKAISRLLDASTNAATLATTYLALAQTLDTLLKYETELARIRNQTVQDSE